MKKYLFFATALVALAACTSDEYVGVEDSSIAQGTTKTISFGSGLNAVTRATYSGVDAATKLNNNFVVEGVKGDGTIANQKIVFNDYNVNYVDGSANTTTSNTAGWEYVNQTVHPHATTAGIAAQSIKFWDYATTQYDFIAYSAGLATPIATGTPTAGQLLFSAIDASKMNGNDSDSDGKIDQGAYTITGSADDLKKAYIADMVTAYREPIATTDYQKTIQFSFRSLSSKVRIALYEIIPGYSVKGESVKFYTASASKSTTANLYTTGTDVFNEAGTYTVYFPTTGSTNKTATDYNKAHVVFDAAASGGTATDKGFGVLDATNKYVAKEVNETNSTDKLYIGRASNEATYAGDNAANYYTVVLPNETGAVLNLKVDYQLISTDGSGETIDVIGATAQVPAAYATWKPGYAYTYLFKISQNGNGATNPSAGPEGLYPITFDAVVVETEDGVQETITTVAEPSITTYAKGVEPTTNNEYTTGSNIYVVLENAAALTVGTNANLYTVTLEAGAAQTINEASVANAIKNGGAASPYIVTDANGKKMTVTAVNASMEAVTQIAAADSPDGNAITVNGAKITAGAAGTIYAFEYIDGTSGEKYYKIIKIKE